MNEKIEKIAFLYSPNLSDLMSVPNFRNKH